MAWLDQRSNRRDRVSVGAGARLADTFHRTTEQDSARCTASQPPLPEDARWNAERPAVEFGVEIGEYRGVVRVPRSGSNGYCRSDPSRAGRRGPLPTTAPVREHRRVEVPAAAVNRGWECGDQRAGLALGATTGLWADRRKCTPRPMTP